MRKLLSIILAVVMLAGMMTVAIPASAEVVDEYASLATQTGDVLYIEDAADYIWFYENRGTFAGKTIKLVADIELNPEWEADIIATTTTTPAGPGADGVEGNEDDVAESTTTTYSVNQEGLVTKFKGADGAVWFGNNKNGAALTVFDGQGHTVSGVYVEGHAANQSAGIFGRMANSVVKNVAFVNCLVYSKVARAGGIGTTVNYENHFENVFADIDVLGKGDCGGIVGLNTNGATCNTYMTNVVSVGEIVGTSNVGGLVGNSWDDSDSVLTNCGFYGSITATGSAGMLVGRTSACTSDKSAGRDMHSKIIINNCVAAGDANYDADNNGAFIGQCYYEDKYMTDACKAKKHYITLEVNNSIYVPMKEGQKAIGTLSVSDATAALNTTKYTATETKSAAVSGAVAPALTTDVYDLSTTWTSVYGTPLPTAILGLGEGAQIEPGFGYVGYQVKAVEGGYAIRFIGIGEYYEEIDAVGFRVGVEGGNLEGLVSKAATTSKVYSGLIVGEEGGEDDYMAPEGSFVYTINVGTFTADMGVVTAYVTTFAEVDGEVIPTFVKTITIDTAKLPELAG